MARIDVDRLTEEVERADPEDRVLVAARLYAEFGIRVLPIRPGGKGLPPRSMGVTYSDASCDIQRVEQWFGPGGKFAGWNIGIACGFQDGVWAMDIDRGDEIDGIQEIERLEQEYGMLPEGPLAVTPSGGVHRLFSWRDYAISSTSKIAPSVDSRGGYDDRSAGHIVAYPSVTDAGEYQWLAGGEVPDIPDWVMDLMGKAWTRPSSFDSSGNRGNEEVGDEDGYETVPMDQIKRMLAEIDPDGLSYEEWLQIGQAIHSQHPDEGLGLWDDWSQLGERYEPHECSKRWRGFSQTGNVTAGTLFYHAKQAGWSATKDEVNSDEIMDLVEAMNAKYAMVVAGGKVRVVMTVDRKSNDPTLPQFQIMTKDDFRILHSNDLVQLKVGNRPVIKSRADIWLAHEQRKTYPNGMAMFPGGAPPGYYNTYRGFSVEPRPGDWSLLKDHILRVICSGDQDHYTWVMDWLADCVQDPGNPKGTAIVLQGKEGTGKGTLANLFGMLWGIHYRHLIDDTHLTNNFNAHMMEAVFVFADEVTWGGNKKSSGKLKGMVTEKYHIGERKGVDAAPFASCIHMMIASNGDWVVPAGPESRRWMMLRVSEAHWKDYEYFTALHDQMERQGGLEAMLHELLSRKITARLNAAPTTKALEQQRIESSSSEFVDPAVQWWEGALADEFIDVPNEGEGDSDWPEVVDRRLLWASYMEWYKANATGSKSPNKTSFYKRVEAWGFEKFRETSGERRLKYRIPSLEDASRLYEELTGRSINQ